MSIILVLYRFAHRYRCMTQDSCWPCDAARLQFYVHGLIVDAFFIGTALGWLNAVRVMGAGQ